MLATFGVFLGLAIIYTWPLARDLGGTFVYPAGMAGGLAVADSLLTSWIVTWVAHALRTQPWSLFDANVLYPLRDVLAFSEHLIASAVVVMPLDVVDSNPVRNNNVLLLATFAVGGTGMAGLLRELGASRTAAFSAGVFAFFGPLRLAQLGHVHALSLHWLPVALALFHRTWRTGSTAAAFALAIALALQALSSVYLAYYSAVAVLVLVAASALAGVPAAGGGRWRVVAAGAVAALVTAPVMIPYARVRTTFALERDPGEAFLFAARGVTYLGAVLDPRTHLQQRFASEGWPVAVVGLGLLVLALIGFAVRPRLVRGGRRLIAAYAVLAITMALLSLGPVMQLWPRLESGIPGPHALLARLLPGFDALRVPTRAVGIVVVALAVLAGVGVDALLGRVGSRWRAVALVLLGGLLAFESWHPPLAVVPVHDVAVRLTPHQRWLAAQPGAGAVVELPFGIPPRDAAAMVRRTRDWRPVMNGHSGFMPARYYVRRVLSTFPDRRATDLLAAIGVRWVVVHAGPYGRRRTSSPCAPVLPDGLRLAREDPAGCIIEVVAAPKAVEQARGERVRPGSVTTSSGVRLVLDEHGALARPWLQPVDRSTSDWIEIELPTVRRVLQIRLGLGDRFGLYLRRHRVEVSEDGEAWHVASPSQDGAAPLAAYRRDPSALATTIDLPAVRARYVRVVRPADEPGVDADLWVGWRRWGMLSIEVRAAGR